jgi:hypothetical protein
MSMNNLINGKVCMPKILWMIFGKWAHHNRIKTGLTTE